MGFNEDFLRVIMDCKKKYDSKLSIYGESWKTCNLDFLRNRLDGEYKEWTNEETNEYDELIDIINVALMTAKRLNTQFQNKEKEVKKQ